MVAATAAGALRGMKDTRMPMLINGVIYWGIGFVLSWGLGIHFGFGAYGIWAGLAQVVAARGYGYAHALAAQPGRLRAPVVAEALRRNDGADAPGPVGIGPYV